MTRQPPGGGRAFRAMLGASVLVHAAVFGVPGAAARLRPERAPVARSARLAERAARVALPVSLGAARQELVARARAERAAGRLRLGGFLLEAGALDAREEGRGFDSARAQSLWGERMDRLGASAAGDLRQVLPEVFGDLHYYGRPGRSMGDALLEGGGACEPLTHLLVAAVHDLGRPERARLRYYGGEVEGGTTHVAPVYPDGDGETDLLTGGPATRTGALIAGADLVDAYARAHGIDPLPWRGPGHGAMGPGAGTAPGASAAPASPPSSSLADGYPPNEDRYPGAVPLYAARAIRAPGAASTPAAVVPAAQPADCAFFLRKAVLDPPSLLVSGAPAERVAYAGFPVEIRRVPTPAQLDRTFAMVQAVERSLGGDGGASPPQSAHPPAAPVDPAERLVALSCLTALYDIAAVDLALTRERDLSGVALEKRRKAAGEGERILAGVDWSGAEGRDLLAKLAGRFSGRSWILLVLPGGDAPVFLLAGEAGRDGWGRTDALAALLVAPATRVRALALAGALPRRAQVDVLHEVFHAHDHLRPWASTYALDGAGEGELARAYRVFRGLAWALWEAARPQEEILAALLRGAAVERLDRSWVASLVEYYGRNALALHQPRADGPALARALARWIEEHGLSDLEVYAAALAAAQTPT